MKRLLFFWLTVCILTSSAQAIELPKALESAIPEEAEDILLLEDFSGVQDLPERISRIWEKLGAHMDSLLRKHIAGVVRLLLVASLCGAMAAGQLGKKGGSELFLPMVGALSITGLTVGSLDSLMGLGRETIRQLAAFSDVLLPTLAAVTAAAGGLHSATVQQMAAVFFVEVFIHVLEQLLLPALLLYVGLLTASACLGGEDHLQILAEGIRKLISWFLCGILFLFTAYLSAARILSGTVDTAAVKVTKAAISGALPVVGGIISESAEAVLAGAGILKGTIGAIGLLVVLAVCGYPFLRLAIQYVLYKLTAALATVIGGPTVCKLINGLGSAFGLLLAMVGSCALLLLISILSFTAAVVQG